MRSSTIKRPTPVLHPITRLIVGGAQENTMYTAARLNKALYQTEILSGPQTGSEGSLIEEVRALGVPLVILPDLLREVSPLHDLRALCQMAHRMQERHYAIVHTHSSKAGILGRLAARQAGIPVIIHTIHGWSFHEYMSPAVRLTYILLERLTALFTDALIVVAGCDIQKGLQAGIGKPDQYHLIRSAIPLEEFDPTQVDRAAVRAELGIPPDVLVVGNVGRFSTQKNPLDWVRAAGIIGRARPQARFLLVGDGPLRLQVEAALAQEGILERTLLTGLRRDAARMMSVMDIFLLTSLWEGLPRVIPQAMAMGLPVIANRTDGVDEAVLDSETGYLCSPGDIDNLAQRCLELINAPDQRYQMGQRGRALAIKEFDLRQMVAQIEDLYETLLEKTN
jgi:glycosyltransferase involved in cell wall biosynthesis